MTVISGRVAALFQEYRTFSRIDQVKFLSLVNAGQPKPEPVANEIGPVLLYERLHHHALALRGFRLPEYRPKMGDATAELKLAWSWLSNGQVLDRTTASGLADIAAEARVREIKAFERGAGNLAQYIRRIPEAVDRAYPGYHANNILLAFAQRVGKGQLPVTPNLED